MKDINYWKLMAFVNTVSLVAVLVNLYLLLKK